MKKKTDAKHFREHLPLYLMLLPGLAYLLINNYIPMAGIIIAFKKLNFAKGILGSPWAGFENFKFLFNSPDAWIITRNTLLYNVAFIIVNMVVGIAIAILICEVRSTKLKKLYQSAILLPFLMSMVILSYIVYALLSSENGLVNNSLLAALGIEGIQWYQEPKYWPFILTFVNLWKSFGYNSIIYYATVIGIDTSLYEAAVVDGANRWQRIWNVTLPGLRPTIITMTLLAVGRVFYSDFGLFYQVPMNSGMLYDVTTTIDVYVYKGLIILNDVGRSAAAGFFQSVCGFILVLTANFVVTKVDKENALF